jgi:Ca-activated chloride channel family protein
MKQLTKIIILVLIAATVGGGLFRFFWSGGERLVVVHWTTGHLMRNGLLPEMAVKFNQAAHRTQFGKRIEIKVIDYSSSGQAEDLLSRVTRGVPLDRNRPDPTIVTPSAAHWLVPVNQAAGRTIVDLRASHSIARAFIGIVTYQEMAECLGWPDKEIGYADIIALRNNPLGWASYPCSKAEWGQRPLVAYTNPTTSSTGRSVLFTLYAIAAGKSPEQLTISDVRDPVVVDYVKQFQNLVDHYMIGTTVLNTKIHQGPRYGHFFLMPEDNLIHLYEGTERAFINGVKVSAPPIERPMVMMYPKEGSMARNNSAGIVQTSWVTVELREAAQRWVDFLREDDQQRVFMAAGFRPGTNLPLADTISGKYGLDPTKPAIEFNPALIDPAVAAAIDQTWEEVKRPGIVTFVLDTSGSMQGDKLQQAKKGMIRALDTMAKNNQVGFLSFNSAVTTRTPVASLPVNRFVIADTVKGVSAEGGTALYDALKEAVEMTDAVQSENDAIRGVVVLTDGRANQGRIELHELIQMMSNNEIPIRQLRGFEDDQAAVDERGRSVAKKDIIGTALNFKTQHPIQIFFIGIGKDADMEVGRMLTEATSAEFQGTTERDLAGVLEEFSKYF